MLLGEPFHKIPSIVSEVIYRKKGKIGIRLAVFLISLNGALVGTRRYMR